MQNLLFFVFGILGALFAFDIVLGFLLFGLRRKLKIFFSHGSKNLEESLLSQIKTLEKQGKDIEKIFEELKGLRETAKKTFQKIGVVRFNPFKEVGSDQSFSIALLDGQNSGFVITGLYEREVNRIYAKPIENGDSKYPLSNEERKAIEQARGLKM